MEELITWFHSDFYNIIFTLITVILSGLISWLISYIYYYIGNRNNLKMSVIYPLCNLLKKQYTDDNYQELAELSKEYSIRYMKKEERKQLLLLLDIYKKVVSKLKKENIDVDAVPVEFDGIFMGFYYPYDIEPLKKDLLKISYNFLSDEYKHLFGPPIEKEIEKLYSKYLKLIPSTDNIHFFENNSPKEIIKNSKSYKERENNFVELKYQVDNFLKLDICQEVKNEMEGNDGNQSK